MGLVQDRCICLRKVEYSESSQILVLFGRTHGLVSVIAKGAHRVAKTGASKFGGGIDLLDVGQTMFTNRVEKDLATLTEWKLAEGHPELRKSLRGLYLGFYAAELVSLLIEAHDPHPHLFDRLEQALLELGSPRLEQSFLAFQLHLLRDTGYLPELSRCTCCGMPASDRFGVSFVPGLGGVICRRCEAGYSDRLSIDGRLLGVVQYVLNLASSSGSARLPGLTRHQTDPINRLLAEHIQHTLGKRLRLPKFVLAPSRGRPAPVPAT